jgi:hypothetical protein
MSEAPSKPCPICTASMSPAFSAKLLRRYSVQYFSCHRCGLLQTEKPYWLAEAYTNAIDEIDTGLVERCLSNRDSIVPIIHRLIGDDARLVDVGGGYGLLTRLLRDRGFDCYTFDRYCENVLARGFEPAPGFRADSLLAFEVLEHVEDPSTFLADAFASYGCQTIIFSTTVFDGTIPPIDWWYYSLDSGQHITFYQRRSLAHLAGKLGCSYLWLGGDLHLISARAMRPIDQVLLTNRRIFSLYRRVVRYTRRVPAKTWQDHLQRKAALNATAPDSGPMAQTLGGSSKSGD